MGRIYKKGWVRFKDKDGKYQKISNKEAEFVEIYLQAGSDYTYAYLKVFNVTNGKLALIPPSDTKNWSEEEKKKRTKALSTGASSGFKLLKKPQIRYYIGLLVEKVGLNDEFVDSVHMQLLTDKSSSVRAKGVELYYKKFGKFKEPEANDTNKEIATLVTKIAKILPD